MFCIWPCLSGLCTAVLFCPVHRRTSGLQQQQPATVQQQYCSICSTTIMYAKVLFFRLKQTTNEVKAMVIKRLYYITSQARQDCRFSGRKSLPIFKRLYFLPKIFYFISKFSSLSRYGKPQGRKTGPGGSHITSSVSRFMVFRRISQRWSHLFSNVMH